MKVLGGQNAPRRVKSQNGLVGDVMDVLGH
jgi:hypothetical protein